jgi:DNA-binding MarR family transcriptional regulator
MDQPAPEDLVLLRNQLCFALYTSSRMIVDAYGPILEPLGLTYEEYLVMMVLWEDAPALERHLVDKLQTSAQEVAEWTDELEAKGFIRREEDAEGATFTVTESGRDLRLRAIETVPDAIRCRVLLPEEEGMAMKDSLERMMENIRETEAR